MILFGQNYPIKRKQAGGYYDDSGKYIEGTQDPDFIILADCQTLTTKELESLNIGRDNLGKIKVFTDEILLLATPGTDGQDLQNGDQITFENDNYEIIKRMPFVNNIISHYEYIAEYREN
jgi:hypothetical protein